MIFRKSKFELSPRLKHGVGRGYSQNQILKIAAIVCLLLAIGLTINAVRLVIRGDNKENSAQVLGASDIQTSGTDTSVEFINYTVVKGDTLFNIAQKFKISWETLATLNNLKSPFYLKPGQSLKVPKPQ